MPRAKPYNWIGLKADFILGDYEVLADFFKERNIPETTWVKWTKGWKEERRVHLAKAAELGARKALTRRSNEIADRITDAKEIREDAKEIRQKALTALNGGRLKVDTARDAAAMLQISASITQASHDLVDQAIDLEDPSSRIERLLGVQVGISQGEGAEGVKAEIKIIARDISRSRVRGMGGRRPLLGPSEHSHGEQPAV